MRVIVAQYGARRRYLIPQILYEKNMLQYLYTDSYVGSRLGKVASLLSRLGINNVLLNRLCKRDPCLPREIIHSNDLLQIKLMLCKFAGGANERIVETIFEGSSSTYIKWGCEGADWLYAMYIENFEYTRYAKRCGVKILADIYENPYIFYDLANEVEALPELRCIAYLRKEFLAQYKLRMKYVDQLLAIADQYLIPSEYVKNELAKNSSAFVESRANIIPYVSSVTNQRYDNVPVKGRIIWVGNDPVRKGLVYALRAFKLLKAKYSFVEFRIIGPMPPEIVQSEYFEDVDFRGYLNKEQLKEEFRQADIYVFPTLSEGFAGSLLEAASFGVPIVTTHASGFGGDFPGLFVREKNVNDIVESISLLMEDRDRRTAISYQLFNYSQKFGKDAFTHKLLRLLHRK